MSGLARRRFATLACCLVVVALAAADVSVADPHPPQSGTKGPFSWEARRAGCGVVGRDPTTIRAQTRWKRSPAHGYMRLTFTRQIRDEDTSSWTRVQRQRRSTKNTGLEGHSGVVHWTQWFFPFAGEAGKTSRLIVRFAWLRDRPGADKVDLLRVRTMRPCVVA